MSVSSPVILAEHDVTNHAHPQTSAVPMDEDILSDVVPSNVVSRQVSSAAGGNSNQT
jgi:hypothetical protein